MTPLVGRDEKDGKKEQEYTKNGGSPIEDKFG